MKIISMTSVVQRMLMQIVESMNEVDSLIYGELN